MSRGWTHQRPGRTVEWFTPAWVFAALGLEFDLDPAAPPGGVPWVPAEKHYSVIEDGLVQPWYGTVWVNPPYGRDVAAWLARLARHGDGLALVFARTDTAWWQEGAPQATAVCLIARRLRFVGSDGQVARSSAGAPSALLAFGLPCALAVAQSGLGQTLIVPRISPIAALPGGDQDRA